MGMGSLGPESTETLFNLSTSLNTTQSNNTLTQMNQEGRRSHTISSVNPLLLSHTHTNILTAHKHSTHQGNPIQCHGPIMNTNTLRLHTTQI